jgi:hypothetical protein
MDNNTKAVVNLDIDKQFFEITEGLINFEVDFEVKTENNTPFEIAVVDQKTLDSDQFPYRRIENGQANGKVTNDSNRRLPFFMVLKSDTPTKAVVVLQKTILPLTGEDVANTLTAQTQQPSAAHRQASRSKPRKSFGGLSEKFSSLAKNRNALLGILLVAGVALWWFKKKKTSKKLVVPPTTPSSVTSSPTSPTTSGDNNFGF